MANRTQIQNALQKPYDRILFGKEVLGPVFGSCFSLSSSIVPAAIQPNKSEQAVVGSVSIYGNINLEDGTEITCYEITLQTTVRIEQSRVTIQRYVRKLLTSGQIALVNFISPQSKNMWRLTLVAKDSEITEEGVKEKTTHAKRYTYLLGPSETCKTAAERFESISTEREITFQALVNAFSVEKLSDAFFDEYTLHYQNFCDFLQESNFRKSVFKISFPANGTKEEKEKACKPIRDFVKKLLGRIVFLYFVQKKRWLGASDTNYKDGLTDFVKQLFKQSGGHDTFYSTWLTVLFFETLNKERTNDDFKMPDGSKVKVPFLNGGLFDKEEHDEHILKFKSKLFHNPDFEDTILTEKNPDNSRGFLDFLNAFNFTVHEDSPDDHIVAVDPEILGNIFENLLEDNKDKGAFYTPKEIVHYMCQESLTEYLTTHLSKEYTVYKEIGNAQVELFGNETKQGQLKIVEQLGDKALNRDHVAYIVKYKDISKLTKSQLKRIDQLLDTVKICDPAIGSGAFPMGLLQEIFAIKEVISFELGLKWKPAEVKENTIQNSIYGVDVEKGAVDIARLRFWLSLIVDEEKPRALPNLDYKIVVGDSLISKYEGEIIEIDWERKSGFGKAKEYIENIQRLLKEIAEKQKSFFKPNNKTKKKQQDEIRNLKLEILINQLSFNREKFLSSSTEKGGFAPTASELRFNDEIKQKRKDFDRNISKLQNLRKQSDESFNHFDWKLDFPEILNPLLVTNNLGFDILIANPPYVSIEGINWDDRRYYETIYKTATGRFDLYSLFIEKAMELKKGVSGVFMYIIPGKFLNNKQFTTARKIICQSHGVNVVKIDEKVFEKAHVDSAIVSNYPDLNGKYRAYKFLKNQFTLVSETDVLTILNDKDAIFKIEVNETIENLLVKIEVNSLRVREIAEVKDGIVAGTIKDILFLDHKKDKDSHKLYFGKHLTKYHLDDTQVWVNYKPSEMMKEEIKRKKEKRPGLWMRDEKIFLREKILSRFVAKEIIATYDKDKKYYEHTLHSTHVTDKRFKTKYILAIFNSSLLSFYYKKTNSQGGDIFPQVRISSIEKMPIKIADLEVQRLAEVLVDYILLVKQYKEEQYIATYFERLIDAMVYEIYFPESIRVSGCEVIKYLSSLPTLIAEKDESSKRKDLTTIQQTYKKITDPAHPLNSALLKLQNVEEVKIIETRK